MGNDIRRVTAHELSHAAANKFYREIDDDETPMSTSEKEKLDKIDWQNTRWQAGDIEEARNRLMDQKRGIQPGTQSATDQALEDFKYVRKFTHSGFDKPDPKTHEIVDTGERFRAARKREEDLNTINDAMEEHFAKYGGGK
jgi:hypothetical protein